MNALVRLGHYDCPREELSRMYHVGIIFNGARDDHEIVSPSHESYEEARTEFRAVNKQRLEVPMLERSWAQLSSDSILAVHITEEP